MSDIESTLKKIAAEQTEQTKVMAQMQLSIDNLTRINAQLRQDVIDLRNGQIRTRFKYINKEKGEGRGTAVETWTTRPGETNDQEIEEIIERRKASGTWPLKRNFCKSFTKEVDLVKVRFHNSNVHTHTPVRIPRSEGGKGKYGTGNKEGRLICRLCSKDQVNRNTSWMCSTCCVPLCVQYTSSPDQSCHYRWHSCDDLLKQHEMVNAELKSKRETKKRADGSVVDIHEGKTKIPKVATAIPKVAAAIPKAAATPVAHL